MANFGVPGYLEIYFPHLLAIDLQTPQLHSVEDVGAVSKLHALNQAPVDGLHSANLQSREVSVTFSMFNLNS